MAKKDFNVLVAHGHSDNWQIVKSWIKELGYTPRVLMLEHRGGTLFERWRDIVWDEIHCAVIVMTKDDVVLKGAKKKYRPRQNLVFELGYCYGAFDSLDERGNYAAEDAVIVIEEKGVKRFANIKGLVAIRFSSGRLASKKPQVLAALRTSYKKAKEFYDL